MRSKMDDNVNWHITNSTSNHHQSFSVFGVVIEPRLGGWGGWPPVILERRLATMCSVIHCKCQRCCIAVEMNNSDLDTREVPLTLSIVQSFSVYVVESLFWWIYAAFVLHFHIPWLIDCAENICCLFWTWEWLITDTATGKTSLSQWGPSP